MNKSKCFSVQLEILNPIHPGLFSREGGGGGSNPPLEIAFGGL